MRTTLLPFGVALVAVCFASYFSAWKQILQLDGGVRTQTRPVLYLLGESITEQGVNPAKSEWVALLQYRYQRSTDVLPREFSGYNTKWFIDFALPVVKNELSTISPSLITLWLGANDAALPNGQSSRQHVVVETYAANLEKIIHTLRINAPDASILVITPPHGG
ncbi:hypothetical protein V7S43_003209 [Phytophthora oleae]|uniref:SGNH hydrolase-type esterase domain-containing protein n=1 Tax=Phytophthora oleae TaxID=2107226 RepID=A0ABD3FY21_9STRA